MPTKEKLLDILDTEISILINDHRQDAAELEAKNNELGQRISKLEEENEQLRKTLEGSKSTENIPYLLNSLSNGITNELIDHLCLSSSIQDAILLLSIAEKLWNDEDYEMLLYILELLQHNSAVLNHEEISVQESITSLTRTILSKDSSDNEPIADTIIQELLDILIEQADSAKEELVSLFKEEEKIFENILVLNNPFILSKYLRLLFTFDLIKELKAALVHILDVEWGFLDSSLTKSDFTFFLWYCYLYDFDVDYLERSSICLQWFKPGNKDISLYFYVEKNEERVNKTELHLLIEKFRSCNVLNDDEKTKVLIKVEKAIQQRIKDSKKARTSYDPVILIKEQNNDLFSNRRFVTKRPIILPLYKGVHEKNVSGFHETSLYVDTSSNEILLEESELRRIVYQNRLIPKLKEGETIPFSWPSTEVSETNDQADHNKEERVMNEKSALMEMGYKVSGKISRFRRWEILQAAVPRLGLQKVAYIIAYNIKMRKRQTNGRKKFAKAIYEWEYDLDKLKSKYYRNEFNWPSRD